MSTRANPRKLLARLEARSLSLADSKPPRANIGTSPDALRHAPPRTKSWMRVASALALLREGTRGQAGPSRIHAATPTKSMRDPDATETIDIAGALAFAIRRPEGRITRAALKRQLAIAVYAYRNWPSFEAQHQDAMRTWSRAVVIACCEQHEPWVKLARKHRHFATVVLKIADTALDEFMHPDHCDACGGHGMEQTGPRVGLSCANCGGAGAVPWSSYQRARAARVRKQDWHAVWSHPYLAVLDRMQQLERWGANLHAAAIDDDD